jgi:hypothetical protein
MVRVARDELAGGQPDASSRCTRLLRLAEELAADVPSQLVVDDRILRSVTTVRAELGTCLLAADQLEQAGVSVRMVSDVLRRGAILAERTLAEAVSRPVTVGASS